MLAGRLPDQPRDFPLRAGWVGRATPQGGRRVTRGVGIRDGHWLPFPFGSQANRFRRERGRRGGRTCRQRVLPLPPYCRRVAGAEADGIQDCFDLVAGRCTPGGTHPYQAAHAYGGSMPQLASATRNIIMDLRSRTRWFHYNRAEVFSKPSHATIKPTANTIGRLASEHGRRGRSVIFRSDGLSYDTVELHAQETGGAAAPAVHLTRDLRCVFVEIVRRVDHLRHAAPAADVRGQRCGPVRPLLHRRQVGPPVAPAAPRPLAAASVAAPPPPRARRRAVPAEGRELAVLPPRAAPDIAGRVAGGGQAGCGSVSHFRSRLVWRIIAPSVPAIATICGYGAAAQES